MPELDEELLLLVELLDDELLDDELLVDEELEDEELLGTSPLLVPLPVPPHPASQKLRTTAILASRMKGLPLIMPVSPRNGNLSVSAYLMMLDSGSY